tara:strand:- start:267 stop:389 length:123 start_codon:yes stop_codon:yes gene_type:complete
LYDEPERWRRKQEEVIAAPHDMQHIVLHEELDRAAADALP